MKLVERKLMAQIAVLVFALSLVSGMAVRPGSTCRVSSCSRRQAGCR